MFRSFLSWIAEARHFLLAAFVIVLTLFVACWLRPTEPCIRLSGLFLQQLGVVTVVWGIRETRAFFGYPSVHRKIVAWFKRCPIWRRPINATFHGSLAAAITVSGRGHASFSAGSDATTDARLDALERNVGNIRSQIGGIENELDETKRKFTKAIQDEKSNRETGMRELHDKVEDTSTGGIHVSAIGAAWVFVGGILSTAAPEIAEYLK